MPIAANPAPPEATVPSPLPAVDEAQVRLDLARIDYSLIFRTRIKQIGDDASKEEFQLRAREATVNLFRANNPGASIDQAAAVVRAAIARETA